LLRRLAAISLAAGFVFAATRAETSRQPRYGGTLRMEIGAKVNSLDPATPERDSDVGEAKNQLDALIYARNPDGTFGGVAGSGPFRISSWEPGKRAVFRANEDFSGGRPFADAVEIEVGRDAHQRLLDLELNKIDLTEIPPEQARAARERGVRTSASEPCELLALVPADSRERQDDLRAMQALSLVIDRAAIVNFILQKNGEPAGSLLPQWSSGTAFLFPVVRDTASAKELWSQITPAAKWVLGYDSRDPLEKSVAERIVVNAREAGLALAARPLPAEGAAAAANLPNARLIRMRMSSPRPAAALTRFLDAWAPAAGLDPDPLPDPASPQDIYERERAILNSRRLVPLVWLPEVYGLSRRVRNWEPPAPGESWPLADVWLDREAP
jgi:ABC-type transport system substrate-binding protein